MNNVRTTPKARTAKALIDEKPKAKSKAASPRDADLRSYQSEAEAVERRIKRLNSFVSQAPAIAQQRMIQMRDYVPPMDAEPRRKKGPAKPRRLPKQQAQMARRRTMRLAFEFLVLALIIAAILGWLNQRFHLFAA